MTNIELAKLLLDQPPGTEVLISEYNNTTEEGSLRKPDIRIMSVQERYQCLFVGPYQVEHRNPGAKVIVL